MKNCMIEPGDKVHLDQIDPDHIPDEAGDKEKGAASLASLRGELDSLQQLLFAENKHKVLVILQAMDTAGKDGTIQAVFEGVNPQGVTVNNFRAPTETELDHDYLWRAHSRVPGKGELIVFNRSHYEDVLVVRVHNLVPPEMWRRRFDQINAFEHMLAEEGTIILKFFLHIDLKEQKKRLIERLENPDKTWKFNPGDLKERELWPEYMKAYEDVLNLTSTKWAPWYLIPANHNWYRNLLVADILVNALKDLKMSFPQPKEDYSQFLNTLKAE